MTSSGLSLCMIVKNEEDCIATCLNSVQDVVDEIIITDTGCTDTTIDICRTFPKVRIVSFPWNGSFSDARNFGIEQANNDWVLWLDADEEVDKADRFKLREADAFEDVDVLSIRLVNYYGGSVDKDRTTDCAHTRLFRRSSGVRFINKIHECLDTTRLPQERLGFIDVKVHHYGYLDAVIEQKGKYERNLTMLMQQLEENESVYWVHYYIASEYYRVGKMKESFEHVNLSIRSFLEHRQMPPSMVYKLKYSILIGMGSFDGAWPGIERAVALYPDYVDLRFFMGVILYGLEKYEAALESFHQCIELGEDNLNHLVLRGVGSFQAWHYIGLCQLKLDRTQDAVLSFLKSLSISNGYEPALESLAEVLRQQSYPLGEWIDQHFDAATSERLKIIVAEVSDAIA